MEVAQVLKSIEAGDPQASEDLLPLVYGELRRLASNLMRQESGVQTLQTTALVHEAYLRLVDQETAVSWDSRSHFYIAAADSMRRILVDNARRKVALKRGGDRNRIDVELGNVSGPMRDEQLVELDEALQLLEQKDNRKATIVKLRFFDGLTVPQIAVVLKISVATVERDWAYSKAWLHQQMTRDDVSFE